MRPQPAPVIVTVDPGTPREDWCTACKAYTRLVGAIALLTSDGVSTVGEWEWCEFCDQEATRD
ncbi:hypothetical protein ACWCPK_38210 [Streptomyces sp. NPDC001953]